MRLNSYITAALAAGLLAVPAMADDQPGYWKIPGTDTSMQIYGYAQLDMTFDHTQPTGYALGLSQANVKKGDDSMPKNVFDMGAQYSRFGLRTTTPSEYGDVNTRVEMYFFDGTNGGSHYYPRIRHLYGTLGGWTAGYTQTNFEDLDASPDYLDPDGFLGDYYGSARWPQIRYTFKPAAGSELSFAIENPYGGQSNMTYAGTGDPNVDGTPVVGAPVWKVPGAVTGRYQYADTWGHISLALAWQHYTVSITNPDNTLSDKSADSLSVALGGHFQFGEDSLVYKIGYGDNNFGAGMGPDTAYYNPTTDDTRVIQCWNWDAGYTHYWNPKHRSNLIISGVNYTQGNGQFELADSAWKSLYQVGANWIWTPTKQTQIGVEYQYGIAKTFGADAITSGASKTDTLHQNRLRFQFKTKFF